MGFARHRQGVARATNVLIFLGCMSLPSLTQAAIRTQIPEANTDIRCADSYRVLHWAEKRFGGLAHPEIKSEAFAQKVIATFLDKVDPAHLLLTQSEADSLEKEGLKTWDASLEGRRCQTFTTWLNSHYARAVGRLQIHILDAARETVWPKRLELTKGEIPELPNTDYVGFAKTPEELRARIAKLANDLAAQASPAMLAAYEGNRIRLIFDTLSRMATTSLVDEPFSLIAKTFLGTVDPYSTYFSSEEYEDFSHELAGSTSGIGVRVRRIESGLLIEQVVEDSPAGKSKRLRAGDLITEVDGTSLRHVSESQSRRILKGEEGSRVTLVVSRNHEKPRRVRLRRSSFTFEDAKIETKVLPSDLGPGETVAVFSIPSFYGRPAYSNTLSDEDSARSSAEDLHRSLLNVLTSRKPPSAVVLDLRGNPGGFLEEAITMAGFFLGSKPVVTVVEPSAKRVLRDEDRTRPLYNGPLVVLVDEESASASEVLAGALQDHQRALVIGTSSTFGKGSVQRLFPMRAQWFDPLFDRSGQMNGAVKITTSLFFSPRGKSPSKQGITPDVQFVQSADCKSEKTRSPNKNPGFLVADTQSALDSSESSRLERERGKWIQKIAWVRERSHGRKLCFPTASEKSKATDAELKEAVTVASEWTQTWFSEVATQK